MIQFIERHSNKILWILILLAFTSFFYSKINLGFVLGLYFLIEVIKERKAVLDYFHKLSFKEYVFHVFSFIILIAILTSITIYSLRFLNSLNSPTWVIYVYLFFLLNISMYVYVVFLDKRKSK